MRPYLLLRLFLILSIWFSASGFRTNPVGPTASVPPLASASVPAMLAATFGKTYPSNGATGIPAVSLKLQWSAVQGYTGAVNYRYCLVTANKSKCPPGKWKRVGTALSATLSNLTPNTTYKWWVRAYDSQNVMIAEADGAPWTFTTMNVPGNFSKSGPTSGTTGHLVDGVTLTWGTSTAATSYQYCVDTTNNNNCDTGWVTASSGITLPNLKSNTVYYWQVRAVNAGGTTMADYGAWWQFTTVVLAGVFGKLSPAENATAQPINGTILSWNISSNATGYEYCVSTSNNTCTGSWLTTSVNVTSAPAGTLTYTTDYYWQVRAVSAGGPTDADSGTWWKFTTQPPAPNGFSKSSPTGGSSNLYTDVTFTWEPSTGAEYYEFCLSTVNNDTTCGDSPWDIITDTSYTVLGLDLGTTWYWQVRAVNGTGTTNANTGTWWSFTTQPNPPLGFTKLSPSTGTTRADTSLTLTWNPSSTAGVSYQVCYDTTDDGGCDQNNWQNVFTGSSYPITGLSRGTTYYWQVRATNTGGTTYADGDMAAWWSFTTLMNQPAAFNLKTPGSGAVSQPLNTTLEWDASSLGVTYEVCYDQTPDSTCDNGAWIAVGEVTSYPLTGLEDNKSYSWQVRATNTDGLTTLANNGNWWQFTTAALAGGFGKLSPTENATAQPVSGVNLTWNTSSNATGYEYCYSTSSAACTGSWQPTTATSAALPALDYNTDYYWQVRALSAGGTTVADNGAMWKFTTQNPAPVDFSKMLPTGGSTSLDTDVTFSWEASTGAESYVFCLSAVNNDSTCGGKPWEVITGTSHTKYGLDQGTIWYWQVRAVNETGTTNADTGTWWSFTTKQDPPLGYAKKSPTTGSTKADTTLTLSWDPTSTMGVSYQVCYDTTDDSACDQENWRSVSSGTSYPVTSLTRGTKYYWQVRATNTGGTTYADGDMAAWWSFTTLMEQPAAFNLKRPELGAVSQPLDTLLEWDASDPGVTYEVCYDLTRDSICDNDTWIPVGETTSYLLTGLQYQKTYEWTVRATNVDGLTSEASNGWWEFSTYRFSPTTFAKVQPANNATIDSTGAVFEWSFAGDGFGYALCYSKTLPLTCQTWIGVGDEIDIPIFGLDPNTTYYWQARAIDPNGNIFYGDGGEVWQFTTKEDIIPPSSSNFTLNGVLEDQQAAGTLQGADKYTFALYGSAPAGTLNLLPSGRFTYKPPLNFNGTVTFQFTVSDGANGQAGPYTVTIQYVPVNDQPVLSPITVPATVLSAETITFTAKGTDVDLAQGQHLTFSISQLPAGATFNPATGLFTWTPKWVKNGVNTYQFTVSVSDGTPNSQPSKQTITITVLPRMLLLPAVMRAP